MASTALNKSASLRTGEKGRGARTWQPSCKDTQKTNLCFLFPSSSVSSSSCEVFLPLDYHGTYTVLSINVSSARVSGSLWLATWRALGDSTRHYFWTKIMTHFQDTICVLLCEAITAYGNNTGKPTSPWEVTFVPSIWVCTFKIILPQDFPFHSLVSYKERRGRVTMEGTSQRIIETTLQR